MQIYTDGYDGHSLRAYGYYGDQMPLILEAIDAIRGQDTVTLHIHENGHVQVVDIDAPMPDDLVEARVETVGKARVLIINSIAIVYEELRGRSKSPTFALAYGGTSFTLIRNLGFSDEEALQIEGSYHAMYEVSDTHAAFLIAEAAFQGYVELAFGLRLRTPTLKATNMNQRKVPYQAKSEGRTANNAASQSYGLLMNRAINATEARIEASEYVNDILVLNTIHDAVYYLARNDAKVIQFLNVTLIEEMEWNELTPIKSDAIPMTAQLDVGKSWDKQVTLENNASIEEITNLLNTLEGETI
ncbi:MAG: DNA polymerase [Thiomicrorhabdus sp.]|jgi:DNA polymerase-1|nr:DNA polymerase [Thiomicrorhabdus sp.]